MVLFNILLVGLVILKQWKPNDMKLVDPKECKCDCWDGLYRGPRIPRNFLSLDVTNTSDYKLNVVWFIGNWGYTGKKLYIRYMS